MTPQDSSTPESEEVDIVAAADRETQRLEPQAIRLRF